MGKDIKRKSGTTVCFLRGNTRAQVHSRTPICLLPKALEGKYPLRCGGKGWRPSQPNLSACSGLFAPRASSSLRPRAPPSRSGRRLGHRPRGRLSAPPGRPRPPARHCREAHRPEVSARASFNLASRPPERQWGSPTGE